MLCGSESSRIHDFAGLLFAEEAVDERLPADPSLEKDTLVDLHLGGLCRSCQHCVKGRRRHLGFGASSAV